MCNYKMFFLLVTFVFVTNLNDVHECIRRATAEQDNARNDGRHLESLQFPHGFSRGFISGERGRGIDSFASDYL